MDKEILWNLLWPPGGRTRNDPSASTPRPEGQELPPGRFGLGGFGVGDGPTGERAATSMGKPGDKFDGESHRPAYDDAGASCDRAVDRSGPDPSGWAAGSPVVPPGVDGLSRIVEAVSASGRLGPAPRRVTPVGAQVPGPRRHATCGQRKAPRTLTPRGLSSCPGARTITRHEVVRRIRRTGRPARGLTHRERTPAGW